jgi:hypothetical protein
MKPITQKQSFCGDFSIIKSIHLTSISRVLIVFLVFFSSTLLLKSNACAVELNSQQVPVKKAVSVPTKSASPKIVKGKVKGVKSKKNIVVKKDTLKDIDPASANSPLYNN